MSRQIPVSGKRLLGPLIQTARLSLSPQHENTAFLPLFGLPKPSSEDGLILSFETLFPGRMWSWRRWWVQLSFWRYMLQVTAV